VAEIQKAGTPWSRSEPVRWNELVQAAQAVEGVADPDSPYAGMEPGGEEMRQAIINRLIDAHAAGIGPVKSRFAASMTAFPDYATLDTRMLRDVFGLSPKLVIPTVEEYEYLSAKLASIGSDSKYLYGHQWLPWEYLTGEKTTYTALIGVYQRVNAYLQNAEARAAEEGVPLADVLEETSLAEQRRLVSYAKPEDTTARIGLAFRPAEVDQDAEGHEAIIQALEAGTAGVGAIKTAFPQLFNLLDDAGLEIVDKIGIGLGGWKQQKDGTYYLDRNFNLQVTGPKASVRWFSAAMLQALPEEKAVMLVYEGPGSVKQDHWGGLTVTGMTREHLTAFTAELSDVFGDGWTITAKARTAKGYPGVKDPTTGKRGARDDREIERAGKGGEVFDVQVLAGAVKAYGGNGIALRKQVSNVMRGLSRRGYTPERSETVRAELEFMDRAEAREVVRGGPAGAIAYEGPTPVRLQRMARRTRPDARRRGGVPPGDRGGDREAGQGRVPSDDLSGREELLAGPSAMVAEPIARTLAGPVTIPEDPSFREAVANTPGAALTDDGLAVDFIRYQVPEQEAAESVRSGVFTMAAGVPSRDRTYKVQPGTVGRYHGGTQRVAGRTLFKRPLVVKAGQGGALAGNAFNRMYADEHGDWQTEARREQRAAKAALDAHQATAEADAAQHNRADGYTQSEGFYERLRTLQWQERAAGGRPYDRLLTEIDLALIEGGTDPDQRSESLAPVLEKWGVDDGSAYERAENIAYNANRGNQSRFAASELVTAYVLRRNGYDGAVAYSGSYGNAAQLGELFDVRAITYPTESGDVTLHPDFQPSEMGPSAMAAQGPSHPALIRAQARAVERGVARIRDDAAEYVQLAGIRPSIPLTAYGRPDPDLGQRIAEFYDTAPDSPDDPQVRAAYDALNDEVNDQYRFLVDKGVTFVPYYLEGPAGDGADFNGYASSRDMVRDLGENNRLYVFADALDHPLMSPPGIPYDQSDNWKFRAVHDYFGHASLGNEFGPQGELNAWLEHMKMFTPLAMRAASTELRGQNSWTNYLPANAPMPLPDRPFADQKAFLLPPWATNVPEVYPEAGPSRATEGPVTETRQKVEYEAAQFGRLQNLDEVAVIHFSPEGNTATASLTLGDPSAADLVADAFEETGWHVETRPVEGGVEVFVAARDTRYAEGRERIDQIVETLSGRGVDVTPSHALADLVTFGPGDYDAIIRRGPGEFEAGVAGSAVATAVPGGVGTGTGQLGTNTSGTGSADALGDRDTPQLAGPSAMASQPADPELVERAVAEFGLTEDPAEAFYVLPDGRMLNASLPGRAGRRIDHDQILRAYDGEGDDRVERRPRSAGERLNYTSYVDDFLERTGAMRWSLGYPSGSLRASVAHPPTRSQQDLVLAEARYVDEVVFEQPGVDPSATQYDMPQDRGRLATDVRRGGAAPLGPSAMASALPDDSRLDAAIRGTAGVHRTPNGIRVEHAARMQTEEQGGQPALRPLHYLLSAEDAREYYTYDPSVAGLQAAGGGVLIDVPKLLRRPYVVETEQYVAAQALWDLFPAAPDGNGTVVDADLRAVLDPFNASGYEVTPELQQATAALAQRYGLDDGYTDTLLGIASRLSPAQRSPFIYDALAEEIAGAELRRQGYDSIIGVSEATGSWVISEIADLQEAASPIPGRPPFLRPEYQQAGPSAMASDRPFGGSASAYHAAVIQQSPTLQAAAAESAATLRDNLADALSEDELFSFGVDERDQRVIDGFAQFYTSAVIGLAANDAERLDSIGLTPAQAEVERERALDLLGTNERMTALYEAEAAWSVLAGPAYGERLGPSAMAATGPPKLAEPFFSPLLRHTGNLPEIMTGVDEVRTPDRTVPERVVRRANTIRPGETPRPNRDGTVTTVVAPNGDWVQPERTLPGEVTPAMTPGQQALAILVEAGAKPDELTWTGLRQWLTQHTGEQLTRVEVSDYLQDNQVQIEEVLYEGRDARWAGPDYDLLTPGGENQRELLLTLPQSAVADANDRAVAALEAEVAALGLPTNTTEDRIKEAGGTEDLAKRWTRFKLYGDIGLPYDAFRSSHWEDPNVVVWVRFNERIDADGKRVLFIEEVQSDWHQTGRKGGYAGAPRALTAAEASEREALRERLKAIQAEQRQINEQYLADIPLWSAAAANALPRDARARRDALHREGVDANVRLATLGNMEKGIGAVPDAPWKATPAWTGLAMRRMIRWAAENGFERIAWTTGDQQNKRSSLTKHISAVAYSGSDFRAWNHDGEEVISQTGVREEDLPKYLGEEVAARLLAQPPEGTLRRLHGLQLETGGKPMRDFYDQILPGVAEDIGKTWGVKVTTTILPAPEGQDPYIQDRGGWYSVHDSDDKEIEQFDREDQAEAYLEDHWWDMVAGQPAEVHAMDLPPLMLRSALEEGQPMFMASGRPEPEGMLPLWDEMDSPDVLDQEIIDAIEAYSAGMEIDDPNALPRTDGPEQIGLILPTPEPPVRPEDMPTPDPMLGPALPGAAVPDMSLLGPVYPDDMNLDQFPEWAQGMLQLGDWADPGQLPGTKSEIDDVLDLVANGGQKGLLNAQEQKVLAAAILLQWARLKRATEQTTEGNLSPYGAAKVVEESRRYTALRGLAALPRAQWPVLAEVWQSSPITQGEGQTLEDFLQAQNVARSAGDTEGEKQAQQAAIQRTAKLAGGSSSRKFGIGPTRPSDEAQKARKLGAAVAGAINSPTTNPSNAGAALADADLSVSPVEFLLAMRYNNVLLGPRGILVDYVTNSGMLFGKMMADPFLLTASEGVVNPVAWAAINAAEYAALARAVPLMMARIGRTLMTGVSDLESEVTGTPRTISGRFGRRIEMAQDEGVHWYEPRMLALQTSRVAAITFAEAAGRLKSIADVGIKELAFGMEQTRQAAIMAYREGNHKVGSKAWHARVAEILAGNINPQAKTREEKAAAQNTYEQMLANSKREAERTTFQGPMGQLGRMMEPLQRHPLGQFVLMFLRALYHIQHWAIDLSPIGAMATLGDVIRGGIYRGLMKTERGERFLAKTGNLGGFRRGPFSSGGLLGGPYQQAWKGAQVGPGVADLDRRILANAIGTGLFFHFLGLVFQGALSGIGPPDDPIVLLDPERPDFADVQLRATMEAKGWRRYSIRVDWFNGKSYWVNYQNWGPLGYMLASAAAVGETYMYGLAADKKRATGTLGKLGELLQFAVRGDADVFRSGTRRFFGVAADLSYLQGAVDLLEVIETTKSAWGSHPGETPSERTKRERATQAKIGGWISWSIVSSFLPNSQLVNTIAQSQDPYARSTEFGNISEGLAYRIPNTIGPPVLNTNAIPSMLDDPLGSPTGRRQGFAVKVDALGRPLANEYAGAFAWLPFRAVQEEMNNKTLDTLIKAGVGAPTPPSEMYYKLPGTQGALMVKLPQAMRQEIAAKVGQAADARVQKMIAETPVAQQQGPEWSDKLKAAMKDVYFTTTRQISDAPETQARLAPLISDSNNTRMFESNAQEDVIKGGGAAPTPTPGPGAAPAATPKTGATPRPGATPVPAAPTLSPAQLEEQRQKARDRAGVGR